MKTEQNLSSSLYAVAVLPADSTSDDLQDAVNSAASGDTIIISSNMIYTTTTPTILIPTGKTIIIQSTDGNNWVLSQPADTESFNVLGNLIFQNITIDGESTGGYISVNGADSSLTMNSGAIVQNVSIAGGVSVSRGTLNINEGAVIQNCHADEGGGGIYLSYGTLNMNSGQIINNQSILGGGIYAYISTVNINNATISNNTATETFGGGIYGEYSTITIENSTVSGNIAELTGGGICVLGGEITIIDSVINVNKALVHYGGGICFTESSFNVEDSEITENISAKNGGGIHVADSIGIISNSIITRNETITGNGGGISLDLYAETEIIGTTITANKALDGGGGGIHTDDTKYSNISTDENTAFSANKASRPYFPPENAAELYPNLKFKNSSITDHPLNNFDINYVGAPHAYHIIYTANGGFGLHVSPDIIPGELGILLSLQDTGISRDGYTFTSWNTAPDGSGSSYHPGDSIVVNDNIILYTQWESIIKYSVNFESNSGTPVAVQTVNPGERAAKPTAPTRQGYVFEGWYTDNGTFLNKWNFNTPIIKSLTLYAKWTQNPDYNPCCYRSCYRNPCYCR